LWQGRQRGLLNGAHQNEQALKAPEGYEYIYRPYYTHAKTGKLIRAKDFGVKAFQLLVKKKGD
jgi:hypothetical protein